MDKYALIVFDLDGTLVKSWTDELLPGVSEFFSCDDLPKLAVVSNQGGVGLRHWMEQDDFGNPSGYPTQTIVEARLSRVSNLLPRMNFFVSWSYQAKSGAWCPIPPKTKKVSTTQLSSGSRLISSWVHNWRKPQPGMLNEAMYRTGTSPSQVLMVGDMDSDLGAATNANCDFMWADKFFKRGKTEFLAVDTF